MIPFLFFALVWFILRGIVDGMVMVKPGDEMFLTGMEEGLRGHVWFYAYHLLAAARDLSLIIASIYGYKLWKARKWFS